MYLAKVIIKLQNSILDPQGKAVQHALDHLGMKNVEEVRIGKYIEMTINTSNENEAKLTAEEACKKLLANEVMENYYFTVEKV